MLRLVGSTTFVARRATLTRIAICVRDPASPTRRVAPRGRGVESSGTLRSVAWRLVREVQCSGAHPRRMTDSISATVFGIDAVRLRGPLRVTSTSSSTRMPSRSWGM